MALIACPECKREVSDVATVCPNCGYPIEKMLNPEAEAVSTSNQDAEKRYQDLRNCFGVDSCGGSHWLWHILVCHCRQQKL